MNPASENENSLPDTTFGDPNPESVFDNGCDHAPDDIYGQAGYYIPYNPAPVEYQYGHMQHAHYVPPSAISTRYYALSNPYTYVAEQPAHPTTHAFPGNPLPAYVATADTSALAHPAVTAEGTPEGSSTTSRSIARADPVLPKQRRNRDDPGGESRPVAQLTTQHEDFSARGAPGAFNMPDAGSSYQYARAQPPPAIVPSQWKLGAALDQLRTQGRGRDYRAAMTPPLGPPFQRASQDPPSPLSREDAARLDDLKARLGLHDTAGRASTSTAAPSPTASTPGTDGDGDYVMNKSAIYSPTTGRKLPLSTEPGGSASVQIVPGTTSAKRPYKRGTPVACTFCRKRKIACGGPQEGDEARRCGPCIQREQACEFPAAAQRPLSRNRHSAGYTGPVIVREFK